MSQEQIAKLESLLERIVRNAALPRMPHVEAAAAGEEATEAPIPTVPPSADAQVALEQEREPEAPAAIVAEESRSRLVAAEPAEPEELGEEVLELDDRHIVHEEEGEAPAVEVVMEEAEVEVAEPPPSSRRAIAEPMEAAGPEIEIPPAPMTPPPESGKQVAAQSDFEDFTGVREAKKQEAPPEEEPIPLASMRTAEAKPAQEMEAELPPAKAPGEYSADLAPPTPMRTGTAPSMTAVTAPAPVKPEITQAAAPTATSVAKMEGAVTAFAPKNFGELLDATLAL